MGHQPARRRALVVGHLLRRRPPRGAIGWRRSGDRGGTVRRHQVSPFNDMIRTEGGVLRREKARGALSQQVSIHCRGGGRGIEHPRQTNRAGESTEGIYTPGQFSNSWSSLPKSELLRKKERSEHPKGSTRSVARRTIGTASRGPSVCNPDAFDTMTIGIYLKSSDRGSASRSTFGLNSNIPPLN